MTELMSCPFCGGKARLVVSLTGNTQGYIRAECKKCEIRTDFYENEREAVQRWNKRIKRLE